jgi:hypothetical protein
MDALVCEVGFQQRARANERAGRAKLCVGAESDGVRGAAASTAVGLALPRQEALQRQLAAISYRAGPAVHDVAAGVDVRVSEQRVQLVQIGLAQQVEPDDTADQAMTVRQGRGHSERRYWRRCRAELDGSRGPDLPRRAPGGGRPLSSSYDPTATRVTTASPRWPTRARLCQQRPTGDRQPDAVPLDLRLLGHDLRRCVCRDRRCRAGSGCSLSVPGLGRARPRQPRLARVHHDRRRPAAAARTTSIAARSAHPTTTRRRTQRRTN